MRPQISVITVCLNAEQTIKETLASVCSQNIQNTEYIVIDGGSTDRTMDIINRYKASIDIVISEPDRGISDAFNKGIQLASGEYIAIINADDYYEEGAFKAVLDTAQRHNQPDIIHGQLRYFGDQGSPYIEKPDIRKVWKYMSVFHPTMFVNKRIYESIGYYRLDYLLAMDSEWVHRALANDAEFVECHSVISNMRLGGASHDSMLGSLLEFRRSALFHGANWLATNYYFLRQLCIQTLIHIDALKAWRLNKRPE